MKNKNTRIAYNFLPVNEAETEIEVYDVIANEKTYDWWTDKEGSEVTPADFKNQLNAVATPSVTVRINSAGGDVSAANAISVAIQEAREKGKKVKCKIDGLCASAAVAIALSCSEISIYQSALMMIHNPMTFMFGYADNGELQKALNMLNATKNAILDLYEKRTGQGRQKLSNMMDSETWFSGQEAVENGFADSVMFDDGNTVLNRISGAVYNTAAGIKIPDRFNIPQNNLEKGETEKMDIKNVAELTAAFPELVNQIMESAKNEAATEAMEKGIEAERNRLKALDEMSGKVANELLNKAKYETFETAENVAVEAIKTGAFVNTSVLNGLQKETEPANNVAGLDGGSGKGEPDAKAHAAEVAKNYFNKTRKGE